MVAAKNLKHGQSIGGVLTPEYTSWAGMIQRCTNSKLAGFVDYGGRGIQVCERWRSFENFFADMGLRPSAGYSIERMDNNGNYEPGNCKWANQTEQGNNQRTNRKFTFRGKTMNLRKWSEELGISLHTLQARHYLYKWDTEKVLGQPVEYHRR